LKLKSIFCFTSQIRTIINLHKNYFYTQLYIFILQQTVETFKLYKKVYKFLFEVVAISECKKTKASEVHHSTRHLLLSLN